VKPQEPASTGYRESLPARPAFGCIGGSGARCSLFDEVF
jgi:hypothetical protein